MFTLRQMRQQPNAQVGVDGDHSASDDVPRNDATVRWKRANELIAAFIKRHSAFRCIGVRPMDIHMPLVTSPAQPQDFDSFKNMQYSVDVHMQAPIVLAGFSFSALVTEGPTHVGIGHADDDWTGGTHQGIRPLFLVEESTMQAFDQVRVALVALALILFAHSFYRCFYIQVFSSNSSSKKFFRAWAGPINKACVLWQAGLHLWLLSVPLYVLKYFGFSVVFFVAAFATLWSMGAFFVSFAFPLFKLRSLLDGLELGFADPPHAPNAEIHAAVRHKRVELGGPLPARWLDAGRNDGVLSASGEGN